MGIEELESTSGGADHSGGWPGTGGKAATIWPPGAGGKAAYFTGGTTWVVPGSGGARTGGATGKGGSATGGKAAGGSATGGKAAGGGISGYSFIGGTGGKATGGSARGGSAGTAGRFSGGDTAGSIAAGTAGRVLTAGSSGISGGAVSGGTAGGSGVAGSIPMAGSAGTVACPAIGCTTSCPIGPWIGLDGCLSCACSPPENQMLYDTVTCAAASLGVGVVASQQIGTVNRWVFDFTWTRSSTVSLLGQPLSATVGVAIPNQSASPIDTTNLTIVYNPATSSLPIEFWQPELVVAGSGVSQITMALVPTSGAYLSIRREGDWFVGGLYMPATSGTSTVMLAGSFNVAVPQ